MFIEPTTLLGLCNLQSTDSVADFGAGSGFLTKAAAALVPQGHVFAIEIHRDIIARLTREVATDGPKNIKPLWGDIEVLGGTKLADKSVNFVILSNVFFHLEDKEGCLNEVKRVLKDGGRMLVIDWTDSFNGMGPKPTAIFPKDVALALCARHGFTMLTVSLPAGDHHYAILFKK